MDIRFACDQCGSRFRVAEKMAGKTAKCTKCGAALKIPDVSDASSLFSAVEDSKITKVVVAAKAGDGSGQAAADSSPSHVGKSPPKKSDTPKEDMIVFLCPNGHELHGPARLQGRPGACPHCGARFQIPDYDEDEEDEAEVFPADLPEVDVASGSSTGSKVDSGILDFPLDLPAGHGSGGEPHAGEGAPRARAGSMRGMFDWLWKQRGNLGIVEIHLKDNPQVLRAGMFAEQQSRGGCAVFGFEESDGSFTISSVPWENISHVTLRNLEDIDEDAFEDPDELD